MQTSLCDTSLSVNAGSRKGKSALPTILSDKFSSESVTIMFCTLFTTGRHLSVFETRPYKGDQRAKFNDFERAFPQTDEVTPNKLVLTAAWSCSSQRVGSHIYGQTRVMKPTLKMIQHSFEVSCV